MPAIKGGSAFITLITGKNPNSEIRGQIEVPVSPSPGTAQTRHPGRYAPCDSRKRKAAGRFPRPLSQKGLRA